MDLSPISELTEYGVVGICIALIILLGFILNRMFKFFGNHISHETDAWNRNTEALTKLKDKISEDISAQKDTATTLRDLKEVIKIGK